MAILSKRHKPDNFETLNSLYSQNLALPIFKVLVQILLNVNLSLNQTLWYSFPYVRQTFDSNNSGNFSITGYILSIPKDSVTLMHGLAVY